MKKWMQFNVYGVVQGVGFRYFTWKKADELNLLGTVRNLHDGSVLIIAGGENDNLMQLQQWLKQGGPRSTKIEQFIVISYEGSTDFTKFSIS